MNLREYTFRLGNDHVALVFGIHARTRAEAVDRANQALRRLDFDQVVNLGADAVFGSLHVRGVVTEADIVDTHPDED